MKITIIGCEPRCLFLIKAFAQTAEELEIERLSLYDPDPDKRKNFGVSAEKICRLLHTKLRFSCTDNLVEALISADLIITLRTPDEETAVFAEEKAVAESGVGAIGSFGALTLLRTARIVRRIAAWYDFAKKYSKPDVKIINLISPTGAVMQTLRGMGIHCVISPGLSANRMTASIASLFRSESERFAGRCIGLSYLCVFDSFRFDGREILHDLLENADALSAAGCSRLPHNILKRKGILPDSCFSMFLNGERESFPACTAVIKAENELNCKLAEVDAASHFDEYLHLFSSYLRTCSQNPDLQTEAGIVNFDSFSPFDKNNVYYVREILRLLRAMRSKKPVPFYLLAPNAGLYPEMETDDVIVQQCEVSENGILAIKEPFAEVSCLELLRRLKRSENLICSAVTKEDPDLAADGLASYPGIGSYSTALKIIDIVFSERR